MRDDKWLFSKLDEVWDKYFPDMPMDNDVQIVWGRKARQRLGSIKQGKRIQNTKDKIKNSLHPPTIITINSLFKDEFVPEMVIKATIAHELAHYAHGFHSPLKRQFRKPHEGGIVHKELDARGAKELENNSKKWLKENWQKYVDVNLPRTKRAIRLGKKRIIIKWI